MKLFLKFLYYKRKTIYVCAMFFAIYFITFWLYRFPVEAVIYPFVLCIVAGGIYTWVNFKKTKELHDEFMDLSRISGELIEKLPSPDSIVAEDCEEIIANLRDEKRAADSFAQNKYNDLTDYYTVWVHQIKTPIAAMRLRLQGMDTHDGRRLLAELARIETYVNMVLTYLRLESDSTDYVFKKVKLDELLRSCVKKFSGEFIIKKLSLSYEGTDIAVLTDEKWLSFVIEQIISNALKYTNEGSVSIVVNEGILKISDTGIGIAASDLRRVFENGYTGFNGREEKRSTGIGLYLCKMICDRLGHRIWIESTVDVGTTVFIDLNYNDMRHE